MGKGGGCVPSKKKKPSSLAATTTTGDGIDDDGAANAPIPIEDDQTTNTAGTTTPSITARTIAPPLKIFVVFYSMYGHVESLAKRMKKGADGVEGVEARLYRVPETLSQEVVEQMKAPVKDSEIPEITAAELAEADGFLFGFPTRYGCMAAQMKAFFDSTGQLWKEQTLAGKPAGFFVSTGTQGGGQETTAWTAITQLAHHGMLFVPIGYTFGAGMFKKDSIRGGSPYGAGVFAGDGSREATETELALAEHQGNYMAAIVKRLAQP
uniref:NAD(P)H dehydrogenase (quinone) n=1 Tax=Brassica campestris TaxID=3711 RepID=M4DMP6_BRACM